MSLIRKIEIPLYTNQFLFSHDENALCDLIDAIAVGGEGWTVEKEGAIYMYVKKGSDPSIVCHESFHAAMLLCKRLGIKISTSNDEAAAYLAEWFFETVINGTEWVVKA